MLVAVLYMCTILYIVRGDNKYNVNSSVSDSKYENNINKTINMTVIDIEYNVTNTCGSDFKYAKNINKTINITEPCNELSSCIGKCCPANKILVFDSDVYTFSCVDNLYLTNSYNVAQLGNYSDSVFYDNNIKKNIVQSRKKLENFIQVYNNDYISDECSVNVKDLFPEPANDIYILENGRLVIRHRNYFDQWPVDLAPGQFCVERQIVLENDSIVSEPELVIRILLNFQADKDSNVKNTVTAIAMLVSCVFLMLVLTVYALLPELRNLAGIMLMTYVSVLTVAFILRALQILLTNNCLIEKPTCIWIGLVLHYAMIASFTWINVMGFDIWWSMRGFRKLQQIHRRGILVKFGWYSLYGWGAPLLLELFIIIVEQLDLTHLPNFVKSNYLDPEICFIGGIVEIISFPKTLRTAELLLYLDGPILTATCINLMLFLMTAYNIWSIKHGVSQHSVGNSRRNKTDETRFGIYLKLSLVMGINWILEVVSALCEPNSVWWYATDVFNSLIGLLIFIIFVCKRNIIVILCKRFSIGNDLMQRWKPVDYNRTESTRLTSKNSRSSKRKMLDSFTETSEIYDQEKSSVLANFDNVELRMGGKLASKDDY